MSDADHVPLFVTIVLDGVGAGAAADASVYGDEGSDTLGHVAAIRNLSLPHLETSGLGLIRPLRGVEPVDSPAASFGMMTEVSAGKDSTSGHWELAGLELSTPFPLYPDGFPEDLIEQFKRAANVTGVLGNVAASGTEIISRLGDEHLATGHPIVYTSADSVFQIATHVDRVPLDALYAMCRAARDQVCTGEHAVGRVIARPFEGVPGSFTRISASRKDFSLSPPGPALPDILQAAGIRTQSVGKVSDLFAGVGFTDSFKTHSNLEGIEQTLECIQDTARNGAPTFVWTNLVDFDQEFGHRNDADGFARALEAFDAALPRILSALPRGARLCITADHGNDPTTPGTDHSREYVPLLFFDGSPGRDLGMRESFADHAVTVLDYFDVPSGSQGASISGRSFEKL